MRVGVFGGTGFIGRGLCHALLGGGDEAIVFTRQAGGVAATISPKVRLVEWGSGSGPEWERAISECDALVNLAGHNLFADRWNPGVREKIRTSRLEGTRRIVDTLGKVSRRPPVLVSGSAIGYYGATGGEALDETSAPGSSVATDPGSAAVEPMPASVFLSRLCMEWEAAVQPAEALGVRVVRLRIGVVLGVEGGALPKMVAPFRFFMGGPVADGRQWFSWIHRDDLIRMILWAIRTPEVRGAVNGAAPQPLTLGEFCTVLGRVMRRPSWLPAPAFGLRLALGDVAELLCTGQRVLPRAAERLGFSFQYPTAEAALKDLIPRL